MSAEASAAGMEAFQGNEVVLLVDDDPGVRLYVARALRQLGYFVLEATDGEDALTVLQEYHAPAHLLIADLVMPEMGGAMLIEMLRQWYPGLKALLISGYSAEAVATRSSLPPGTGFLPKPFDVRTLARTVREVLDADPAPA